MTTYREQPVVAAAAALDVAAEPLVDLWQARTDDRPVISPQQLRVLRGIAETDLVTLGGLGQRLGLRPSSATRICDRLQAAGLIRRSSGEVDRREVRLALTAEGHRLLDRLRTRRRHDLADALARMSPEGRKQLFDGLLAFAEAAGEAQPASVRSA